MSQSISRKSQHGREPTTNWKKRGRSPVAYRVGWFVVLIALPTWPQTADPHALLKEAERLFWLDNWYKARPIYSEAEKQFEAAGDIRNALFARIGRLRADADQSGYPAVSQFLADQLATPLVQNDAQLKLRCLVVKASIDLSIDPTSSESTWKQAQALADELGEKGWANRAVGELAIIAFLKGNTKAAQEMLGKAVMTSMFSGDVAGEVRQLSLAAVGLGEIGLSERALQYADRALQVAAKHPDMRFPLMAHMAKAKALEGKPAEVEKLLTRVLEFVEDTQMAVYRADVLLALGIHEDGKGNPEKASQHLQAAAVSAQSVGMPRPEATALFRLARIYQSLGKLDDAERTVDRAVEVTRQLVDMYVLPRQLATAATIKLGAGKVQDAVDLYDEAADLVEAMLVNVPSTSLRSSLVGMMSSIYEGYAHIAFTRLKDPEQAFRVVELARGRAAADALRAPRDNEAVVNRGRTPEERSIVEIQIQLQKAQSKQRRRELLAKLSEAEEMQMAFLDPASHRQPVFRTEPIPVAELRRNLRVDEVVLEYVLGQDSSHVLVITREAMRAHSLPPRSDIEALCKRLLDDVRARKHLAPEVTRRLYSDLLGPVGAGVQKKRLIVIPDGILHFLPFDVLRGPTGKELCDTHIVSYVPSATALHVLRTREPFKGSMLPLLAMGAVGVKGVPAPEPKLGELMRTSRGMFDPSGGQLPPLPATAREVREITALFGPTGMSLVGEAATESAFKSQPLDRFRVLHLAVHGLADPKFPDRSSLVLGPAADKHEDGLLQVREIRSLRLNTDLVTLSACDTGLGRLQGQEGMANLVRAFLVAGSRNVVSALWEVDDSFGAALMKRFYERLAQGQDVAAALHLAKVDLRRRYGPSVPPFYWAPFVVAGDAQSRIQRQ